MLAHYDTNALKPEAKFGTNPKQNTFNVLCYILSKLTVQVQRRELISSNTAVASYQVSPKQYKCVIQY